MPTGIYIRTEEARKNMSEAHIGKLSGMKGKHHSEKTKMMISSVLKGRESPPFSEEHRKNISNALKGKHPSIETRKKLSESHKGKKGYRHSQETKLKISVAHKGKKISIEIIKKISLSCKGRKSNAGSFKKGHRESEEIKKKRISAITGELNWNWKGGISSENSKIRNSLEMKAWRKKVFERDNFICRECGRFGHKLEPHHLLSFTQFPQFRFALWNGITLCIDCHELTNNYKNKRG